MYDSFNSDTKRDKIKSSSTPITVEKKDPDYEKQRPLFAWLPTDIIKRTYELTT